MEVWASVVVAIVSVVGGFVGILIRDSRAKSQLDSLAKLRAEILATSADSAAVKTHLRTAELHLAKRIEFRFRRTSNWQTLAFSTGMWAAIWAAAWTVVSLVSALSTPDAIQMVGLWPASPIGLALGGFVVFLGVAVVTIGMQGPMDKKFGDGTHLASANRTAVEAAPSGTAANAAGTSS